MSDPRSHDPRDDDAGGRASDLLRKAREGRKLTQQEVATRLHLELRIITAIDNGQFSGLASPAYTRGYLRSYARLLEMDGDSIIAAYNIEADDIPPILPHASSPAQQVESSDTLIKAISWLVGIVLLALLLLWARERFAGQDFSLSDLGLQQSAQENPPAPAATPTPPTPPSPSIAEAPVTELEPYRRLDQQTVYPDRDGATQQPPAMAPTPVMAPQRPGASAARTSEEPDTSTDAAGGTGAPPVEGAEATTAGTPTQAAEPTVATGPELRLQLADKAWIEITGADGKRMYYNLGKPGEIVAVSGRLPYTVKIGNAGGVTASLGGRPLDLAPYSVEGIARLRINGADDIVENR